MDRNQMKSEKFYFKANLVFIFIILNIWDLLINRILFNGMVTGIVMFGPAVFLWFLGSVRAVVLLTLISVVEFMLMLIFVGEGVALGGTSFSFKSAFFIPFLFWAGVNGYWGLGKYYAFKEGRGK